jgi:hypothetical protein
MFPPPCTPRKLETVGGERVEAPMVVYRLQSAFVIFDCETYEQELPITLQRNYNIFNGN